MFRCHFGLGLLAAIAALALPARSDEVAYSPADGPHAGKLEDGLALHDKQRDKDLPLAVAYPRGDGPFPLIVLSHGAGGSGANVAPLARFWASHGYVVLLPTHDDSIALRRRRGEVLKGGLRDVLGTSLRAPEAWEGRARDVSFLLDSVPALEGKAPDLKGRADLRRIGVGGHSLGAYTAQLIGGVSIDVPGRTGPQTFGDDRVKAILLLSGQGTGQQGLTDHSWDRLTRPMMSMTGTRDRGAQGQGPDWKKEAFDPSPPGDKYHVLIEGAHHGSFTGRFAGPDNPAGRLAGARNQKAIFDDVKIATLAFWDAYLKDIPAAREYLQSDALEKLSQGAVKLSRK